MGRKFESLENLIAKAIGRKGDKHGDRCLVRDGMKIFCPKCTAHVTFKRGNINSRVDEHLKSVTHMSNRDKPSSALIKTLVEKQKEKTTVDEQFKVDLLELFLSTDIALDKLKQDAMVEFFKKYVPQHPLPHPNTLRLRMDKVAEKKLSKIKEIIGDSDVYFMVDETSDSKSRNVVNVIVGKLNNTVSKPMLLHVAFQKVTNSKTIQEVILDCCKILWPEENRYPKLSLLLSDQAAYMVAAGKQLKQMAILFPNLQHVTCINHALSLVCNSIVKEFYLVNKVFSLEKKWFKNGNKRKLSFRRITGLKLIPFPVEIRWGTWLACADYHRKNLTAIIKYFTEQIDPHSTILTQLKKIFSGEKIGNDILRITDKYSRIPVIITALEAECLRMDHQLELLNEVIKIVNGTSHANILANSLNKNPDFHSFTSVK